MDGRRMGARAVLLVVLGAWHTVVLLALMPRPHRDASGPEFVSVLPRLDPVQPVGRPNALLLELSPVPVQWQSLDPTSMSSIPEESAGAAQEGTAGSTADWNAEAARAARSAAEALPPVPEDRPAVREESYWTRPHKKGEEAPAGFGRWLVWVSEHCYTIIDHTQPSAAGRPMVVRCPKQKAPIDAEVLSKRRPRYLDPPEPDAARDGHREGGRR